MHISVALDWHVRWDNVPGATDYDIKAVNEKDATEYVTNHAASDVLLSLILAAAPDKTSDWSLFIRATVPTGKTDYSHAVQFTVSEGIAPADFRIQMVGGTLGAANSNIFIDREGNDGGAGTAGDPYLTLQKALDVAAPGDRIWLNDGQYFTDAITKTAGVVSDRITVGGTKAAIISGSGASSRVFEINHGYYTVEGLTMDGFHDITDPDVTASYRDKLIYCIGLNKTDGLEALIFRDIRFQNAGGEMLRIKYFARNCEVDRCTFQDGGIDDFRFAGGGKNGEAVYIGTSPGQTGDNPTNEPDVCDNIWVHDCYMNTNGNEGVDIKEASINCVIEYNDVTGQQDTEAAGLTTRANGHTFRFNTVHGCRGSGIRLRGAAPTDGINNTVRDNNLYDCDHSGFKVERDPQTLVCDNKYFNFGIGPAIRGAFAGSYSTTDVCP